MDLDYESIRDTIETRWRRHGYDALLPEERDYLLVWWLEAEASNGSLHQYFDNSTGDAALDTLNALRRINAQTPRRFFPIPSRPCLTASTRPTGYNAERHSMPWKTLTTHLCSHRPPIRRVRGRDFTSH